MYTKKEVVHEFLGMHNEVLIESNHMQWEVISNPVPFGHVDVYLPTSKGLIISDDIIANLSSHLHLYKEFGVPYNTCLSKEFYGLVIHSCGNFEQNLENLLRIPYLGGMDMVLRRPRPRPYLGFATKLFCIYMEVFTGKNFMQVLKI